MSRFFVSFVRFHGITCGGVLLSLVAAALGENRQAGRSRPVAVTPAAVSTVKEVELLDVEVARRRIRAEKLNREILRTIEIARKESTRDPDASLGALKRALTAVIASTDIDSDVREALRV